MSFALRCVTAKIQILKVTQILVYFNSILYTRKTNRTIHATLATNVDLR